MIRSVATTEKGQAVYGLTIRGIALLGAALGVVLAAVVIGVIALSHANKASSDLTASRRNSILVSCEEQNDRHAEAKLGIEVLAKSAGPPPRTRLDRLKQEHLVNSFVNALVPSYNCAERVAKFTKP